MPPVLLGALLFAGYGLALILRKPVQRRLVAPYDASSQVRRQFFMDLVLSMFAGAGVMAYVTLAHEFPLISGFKLVLGTCAAGFFMGIDMSLDRQRRIILSVLKGEIPFLPLSQMRSMINKLVLAAVGVTLVTTMLMGLIISMDLTWLAEHGGDPESLSMARGSVLLEIFFVMGVLLIWIFNIIHSYSKNLKLLFDNQTLVLNKVTGGDLSRLVPVVTQDEFGVIADRTNRMIFGLRHRFELMTALEMAKEVQENLLPQKPLGHDQLDMAGKSRYCDETGGDYYDWFHLPNGCVGVLAADAADHGVGSALYMTGARAYIRARIKTYSGPARLLAGVNEFLEEDSRETGRFMTLFFAEIHVDARQLRWVRAGHEPGLFYDPATDAFIPLGGKGMALGLGEEAGLEESQRQGWTSGSLLVLATDGIKEAENSSGEMFGPDRLTQAIRNNAKKSAREIIDAVFDAVDEFSWGQNQADDYTLVVVRLP